MTSRLLFLAIYMKRGFGVAVVIDNLSRIFRRLGVEVTVGCLEHDDTFPDLDLRVVAPKSGEIARLAQDLGCGTIVAHTTPYFEVLPKLSDFKRWAWEHGDPNPAFFFDDRLERHKIIAHKSEFVYPNVTGVIAISEFVRREIALPEAVIVPNGCDHVPDLGAKKMGEKKKRLDIGTLVRLGSGESIYKGKQMVFTLKKAIEMHGIDAKFHLMGRGTEDDAREFEANGFDVHLNASDEERAKFLRRLDVFVSTSLWEGCNLPLLEAQASGTAGLAFDAGAHPETTPLVCRNISEMVALISRYDSSPDLLSRHSNSAYRYVRAQFNWARSAERALATLGVPAEAKRSRRTVA